MIKYIKNDKGEIIKEIHTPPDYAPRLPYYNALDIEELFGDMKNDVVEIKENPDWSVNQTQIYNYDHWYDKMELDLEMVSRQEIQKIINLRRIEPDVIQLIWDHHNQYYCTKAEWLDISMNSDRKRIRRKLNRPANNKFQE